MEQHTRLVPPSKRKLWTLDRELDPYAQRIRQSGVEAIWKIGEQLQAAKARVIELSGDHRAPGFTQWTHYTFGWSKSTVSRYIKAFQQKNENLKQIWGTSRLRQRNQPNGSPATSAISPRATGKSSLGISLYFT